jgi:glycosyltransferase involved in cell wall biosynthesis
MRIAIISGALPPSQSGEAASTWFLGRELARCGHDVHVLTTRRTRPVTAPPGTTLHDVMRVWTWREAPLLVSRLRSIDPQGVLLFYMTAMYGKHPMITFAPTLVRRALPAARFVTRFEHVTNGATLEGRPRLSRAVYRAARLVTGARGPDHARGTLLRDSDAVIALCDSHGEHLERLAPSTVERLTIIPPPPNIEIVPDSDGELRRQGRARVGAASSDFLVGYFGYVYPGKGIETLLRALAHLRARRANVRLLLLGGRSGVPGSAFHAYYDDVQALARSLGVDEAVAWVADCVHGDPALPELIHAADVWALPFEHGGSLLNSSLTSLASYGVPLVTTRAREPAFVDGENMLLVPPGDAQALSAALERLASDPALRVHLRAGIERLASDNFAWPTVVERTLRTLRGDVAARP